MQNEEPILHSTFCLGAMATLREAAIRHSVRRVAMVSVTSERAPIQSNSANAMATRARAGE